MSLAVLCCSENSLPEYHKMLAASVGPSVRALEEIKRLQGTSISARTNKIYMYKHIV